jgi:hypothetical protein
LKINKILFFLFKLIVSAGSLYLVFSKTDINVIFLMMKKIGPFFLLAAACIYILSLVVSSYRWKLLLPENFRLRRLFSLYMIGAFFSSFLPGVIGGDVVKAYYLNKDARKISLTLASIFMDRYLGYVSLMIIGIVAFPFAIKFFGVSVYKWAMPVIFVSFLVGSFLFFGLQLGRRFRVVSEFYEYFESLKTKKGILVKTVALSIILQMMGFFSVSMLAHAMGENIPILPLFVFLPIIITIMTIPVSISGLGVREGAFVVQLGLIGVKPEVATSLSLSWFFSNFLGSFPGLIAYMRHTGRLDRS